MINYRYYYQDNNEEDLEDVNTLKEVFSGDYEFNQAHANISASKSDIEKEHTNGSFDLIIKKNYMVVVWSNNKKIKNG